MLSMRFALALAFLGAPLVQAQISEKAAVERLEDAIDEADDEFKDALKAASKNGVALIKAYGKDVESGGFAQIFLEDFHDDLADVQRQIRDAYDAALLSISTAGSAALVAYAGDAEPDSLAGIYPKPFYERQGGLLSKVRGGMDKRVAKVTRKLASLLKKTFKDIEKDTGYPISFHIAAVGPTVDITMRQEGAVAGNGRTQTDVTIDLVFSWSNPETVGAGRVMAGGTSGVDTVATLGFAVGEAGASSAFKLTPLNQRWSKVFFADEGNYVVSVYQDTDADFDGDGPSVAIGVR